MEIVKYTIDFFGGFFNHFLADHRDCKNRKRFFLDQIRVVQAKLLDTDESKIRVFHDETRGIVRDECAKIISDIAFFHRAKFKTACADYCDFVKREHKKFFEQLRHRLRHGNPNPRAALKSDNEKGRLNVALQTLIDCAR